LQSNSDSGVPVDRISAVIVSVYFVVFVV